MLWCHDEGQFPGSTETISVQATLAVSLTEMFSLMESTQHQVGIQEIIVEQLHEAVKLTYIQEWVVVLAVNTQPSTYQFPLKALPPESFS